PLASKTVTGPVAVWTLPIAWGGGTPIAWAQPPKAPSSLRIADVAEHATPPCAVRCLAMSRLLLISRHAYEPSHALPALPGECARRRCNVRLSRGWGHPCPSFFACYLQ